MFKIPKSALIAGLFVASSCTAPPESTEDIGRRSEAVETTSASGFSRDESPEEECLGTDDRPVIAEDPTPRLPPRSRAIDGRDPTLPSPTCGGSLGCGGIAHPPVAARLALMDTYLEEARELETRLTGEDLSRALAERKAAILATGGF